MTHTATISTNEERKTTWDLDFDARLKKRTSFISVQKAAYKKRDDQFPTTEDRKGEAMALHVAKYERRDSTNRKDLANAALEACRSARETSGVKDSRFYWVNPVEIAILTDAEPGAWGQGSGNDPQPRSMKAMFALADLARNTSIETWADARSGEETYKVSQS